MPKLKLGKLKNREKIQVFNVPSYFIKCLGKL